MDIKSKNLNFHNLHVSALLVMLYDTWSPRSYVEQKDKLAIHMHLQAPE